MLKTEPANSLQQEVATRLGLLPNFFCASSDAPHFIEGLWSFAKTAYLDNPLPSLFKERLFVHLSRFCEFRYCILRHAGYLVGLARPAGDGSVTPNTVAQVTALLQHPIPEASALHAALGRLEALPFASAVPPPETQREADILDALTVLFLEPARCQRARLALHHAIGPIPFECVTALLAFIRTAHSWSEMHPELVPEEDVLLLMEAHPGLASLLLRDANMEADDRRRLKSALGELDLAKQEQALLRTALHKSEERFPALAALTAELRVDVAERDELLAEVHHRVKNNLHVITSLLEMQARHAVDPASSAALAEICNKVVSIAKIHEILYQSGTYSAVDLLAYAQNLVAHLVGFYGTQDRMRVAIEGEPITVELERAVPFGLLLNELVSNSCKHAFPDGVGGRLWVSLGQTEEEIWLSVHDDGMGLPVDFDPQNSSTRGLQIIGVLALQLKGSVVFPAVSKGTHVDVRIPRRRRRT